MNITAILDALEPVLGDVVAAGLRAQVQSLVDEADDPWKRSVLALVTEGVAAFGPKGVSIAVDAVRDLLDGKGADLSWASLRAASDVLATMQNAEADSKSASKDFLMRIGVVSSQIFSGFIKGLIASV